MKELAKAITELCGGSQLRIIACMFILYMVFNLFEAAVEAIIWGKPFSHRFDYLFMALFVGYTVYVVYVSTFYKG
jgi:hypothetical protein